VTGSKFFGGPAFSGAVLWPCARPPAASPRDPAEPDANDPAGATLGTVLRWVAATTVLDRFAPRAAGMAALLRDVAALLERRLAALPRLVAIGGLQPGGRGWADLPSIFTVAVRDASDPARLLSATELGPLYRRLGRCGVLLGQPVSLGAFGGLRIAVGARDLVEPADADRFDRLFAALAEVLAKPAAGNL
jgi:hypothetical protein